MSAQDRLPVFATRGTLNMIKIRLAGARRSHVILKRKADGITVRFRIVSGDLVKVKERMADIMTVAFMAMARANFIMGDFSNTVLEAPCSHEARLKIKTDVEHVVGVGLTNMFCTKAGKDMYPLTGMGTGFHQLVQVKEAFAEAANLLVRCCSLENAFIAFDEALQDTNRRLNATDHVIIPRLEITSDWITSEMSEMEREDFYRMKMIKKKKLLLEEETKRLMALEAAALENVTVEELFFAQMQLNCSSFNTDQPPPSMVHGDELGSDSTATLKDSHDSLKEVESTVKHKCRRKK